jgi:hypothetical protein
MRQNKRGAVAPIFTAKYSLNLIPVYIYEQEILQQVSLI